MVIMKPGKTTDRDYLDDIARKFMATINDSKMSLDEFMYEYEATMSVQQKMLGWAIVSMYDEYGGPVK
jgi:hypothetical protein